MDRLTVGKRIQWKEGEEMDKKEEKREEEREEVGIQTPKTIR